MGIASNLKRFSGEVGTMWSANRCLASSFALLSVRVQGVEGHLFVPFNLKSDVASRCL